MPGKYGFVISFLGISSAKSPMSEFCFNPSEVIIVARQCWLDMFFPWVCSLLGYLSGSVHIWVVRAYKEPREHPVSCASGCCLLC